MALSNQEWWNADVDRDAADEALRSISLEVQGWNNRRPVLPADTDWDQVEAAIFGSDENFPEADASFGSPDSIQKKRGPKKKGAK